MQVLYLRQNWVWKNEYISIWGIKMSNYQLIVMTPPLVIVQNRVTALLFLWKRVTICQSNNTFFIQIFNYKFIFIHSLLLLEKMKPLLPKVMKNQSYQIIWVLILQATLLLQSFASSAIQRTKKEKADTRFDEYNNYLKIINYYSFAMKL